MCFLRILQRKIRVDRREKVITVLGFMKTRIGIDLMGGDHSPFILWDVLMNVLKSRPACDDVHFVTFASKEVQSAILEQNFLDKIPEIVVSENFVSMEDSPLVAIRKKSSSMAIGLNYLHQGDLDAFISTGNTAALVTLSRARIPLFPMVSRPALLVQIPARTGSVVMLDVGANVSVKPEEMLSFAHMGIAYKECLKKSVKGAVKVGLLNIGSEEKKGTEAHRQTFSLLREVFQANFFGNIESGDVFDGKVDVVVTDGFTGNVFLKATEGLFDFLRSILGDQLESDIRRQLDYTIYPGSLVCGLSKLVIKCHGKARGPSLFHGISGAIDLAQADVCQRIRDELTENF